MEGKKPEGQVDGQPAGKTAEPDAPKRTVTPADLMAAAARARSEGEKASTDATAAGGPSNDAKPAGEATATPGTEAGKESTPAGKPAEPTDPAKSAEPAKDGKDAKGDPLPDDDPFWKTSLGRKVSAILKNSADVTGELAELKAKITLLEAGKAKPAAAAKAPSDEEAALEKELGLDEIAGEETADGKKKEKPEAKDPRVAKAEYTYAYMLNFAKDEYAKNPRIAEIKALMLNKDDPANTYNKSWFTHPDADFDKNFSNAERFLEEQARKSVSPTPPVDAGKLKQEPPAAALGVGGDTKGTDGKEAVAVKLDDHAKNFLAHIASKGRDPDALVKKAFPEGSRGAVRSAP